MKTHENGRIEFKNKDGRLHRKNGPAVIWDDGDKEWFLNGEHHRADGPALILGKGYKEWFLNGTQYNKMDSVFDEAREKYPERFI